MNIKNCIDWIIKGLIFPLMLLFFGQTIIAQEISHVNIDSVISLKNSKAKECYIHGMYEEAVELSEEIINLKLKFKADSPRLLRNNYLNISNVYSLLGEYDKALYYLNKAYFLYQNNDLPADKQASILNNFGSYYQKLKDYNSAIKYYQQAISLLENEEVKSGVIRDRLIFSLENTGKLFFLKDSTELGIEYHEKAIPLCNKNVNDLIRIYNSLGSYLTSAKSTTAKEYYELSQKYISNEIKDKELLFFFYEGYGRYYYTIEKKFGLAANYLNQALTIALEEFRMDSYILGIIYEDLAKMYFAVNKEHEAIKFVQKYFSESSADFDPSDILTNPQLSDNNFRYNLIVMLELKAKVCYNIYKKYDDQYYLDAAINSVLSAIEGINLARLRINNEVSRFDISKDQINTFRLSQQFLYEKYLLTGDVSLQEKMFEVTEKGRNFSLLSSIRSMKAVTYGDIPDSLLAKEKELDRKISFYNEMILNEKGSQHPRSEHIRTWEKYVLELGREHNELIYNFEKNYPSYYKLKYDDKTISMEEISQKLSPDELVIEFSLTDSLLFTYLISKDSTEVLSQKVDSSLNDNCMRLYELIRNQSFGRRLDMIYSEYVKMAYEIYAQLLKPIEEQIRGRKLLIIPDGAISFVPFDALLTQKVTSTEPDYRHLPYLIRKNAVSLSYGSTIHFRELINHEDLKPSILAFAPKYDELIAGNAGSQFLRQPDDEHRLIMIPGVEEEVNRIVQMAGATVFRGRMATETNFKKHAADHSILHLAMHTILDDENPLYSKLAFTPGRDTLNDSFLHTYEIYNMKFRAHLAVLSSCGSGSGNYREGEGTQSLARGFAYAGCPSILMTLWEVADQSTVEIMDRFYYHLRRGKSKPEALQLSKLEFLDESDQMGANPFFWSSFAIMGNTEAIYPPHFWSWLINIGLLLIPVPVLVILYSRNRKN